MQFFCLEKMIYCKITERLYILWSKIMFSVEQKSFCHFLCSIKYWNWTTKPLHLYLEMVSFFIWPNLWVLKDYLFSIANILLNKGITEENFKILCTCPIQYVSAWASQGIIEVIFWNLVFKINLQFTYIIYMDRYTTNNYLIYINFSKGNLNNY